MSGVDIRPGRPADIAAITRIYAHAVQHGTASFELERAGSSRDGAPPERARRRRLSVSGCRSAPARSRLRLCGPYRRAGLRLAVEDSIYVAPEFHRQAWARACSLASSPTRKRSAFGR